MTRTGLVLGAGGLLGSAWMTGALGTVERHIGRPLGELELVLGTSAGSVLGAALRCGMTVDQLRRHHHGADPATVDPALDDMSRLPDIGTLERESGNGLPPLPWPVIGSPWLLAHALLHPGRVHPLVAASSMAPLGRGRMDSLADLIAALQSRTGLTTDRWIPGPPLWVVAVDYDSGRRVVFGRAGAPKATVGQAVMASTSIPGWFAPRVIGGHRYVDGGVQSATSLALLAKPDAPRLDEVYVLAPMASHDYDRPRDPIAAAERTLRKLMTRWFDSEVRAVRATGTRVTVLTPGPRDLAAMGGNLMDPRHRAEVLATSLLTTPARFAAAVADSSVIAQGSAA